MKQMLYMDVCSVEINCAHFCRISFFCHIATFFLLNAEDSPPSYWECFTWDSGGRRKVGTIIISRYLTFRELLSTSFCWTPLSYFLHNSHIASAQIHSFLDFPRVLTLLLCQISTLLAAFQFLYQTLYLYFLHSDSVSWLNFDWCSCTDVFFI